MSPAALSPHSRRHGNERELNRGGADFDRADGGAGIDTERQCEMTARIP